MYTGHSGYYLSSYLSDMVGIDPIVMWMEDNQANDEMYNINAVNGLVPYHYGLHLHLSVVSQLP